MARGDNNNRTGGGRKSPFPPLRLVQNLPDSDDVAPRSSSGAGGRASAARSRGGDGAAKASRASGAGKGTGGARPTGGRSAGSARASSHGQQVRGAKARANELRAERSGERVQPSSAQARKARPAKARPASGVGQGPAASRNTQPRPAPKGATQKAAGPKAAGQKASAQRGSSQNTSARGAQRGTGRGGQSAQARSSQGRSAQAGPLQGRSGQASNAQGRTQGRPAARAGQARSAQGRTGQARTRQGSQGRSAQGSSAKAGTTRTGTASTARRGAAGGQRQNPRKQTQGAPSKRRVNTQARPSRPGSHAPERRRPPANRPKKPPRQPMDPALKASLMRLGRNVFLVVLTVVLVVWGFNYVTETVRVQNLQAARQNQGSGMPTPLACDPKNLDVTVTLPAQVARGQALTVNLKVANKANIPCIFDVGSAHLQMRVTSGTDTVYDAAACKAEPVSRKMLLAPLTAKAAGESAYVSANPTPDSFTTSVSWNGQRYKADCSSAGPSQAGTYVLRLNLDGKELVGQQVFIVK